MPVSRGSQAVGASLLGHFQPTKKTVGGNPNDDVKGKSRARGGKPGLSRPSPLPIKIDRVDATAAASAAVEDEAGGMTQTQQAFTTPPDTKAISPDPSAASSSRSSPSSTPALLGTPFRGSRSLSTSPPPELLKATHRSPVSVREDPDKGKFYLMYSSPKKGSSSSASPSQLHVPAQTPFGLRQTSPSLDRTPIREILPDVARQPPQAPKKRQLDETDIERLRMQNEESPLPQDKRRPSYRAFGASQDAGLTLRGPHDSNEGSSTNPSHLSNKRPRYDDHHLLTCDSLSSSDDELVITPRKVREQPPKGISPPSFATPTKAAKFDDPFTSTPRVQPIRSAGIFSSLIKPTSVGEPRHATSSDEDNPFLDSSPCTSSSPSLGTSQSNFSVGIPHLHYSISASLPLPSHYNSLYLLHTGIEHALVVHLATTGLASSSIDSTFTDSMGQSIVRLPNLITYTALRPLVERTAGRRLGSVELARLMYIWSNGRVPSQDAPRGASSSAPVAPAAKEQETLSGLGFMLARQRSLDSNGRRKWDWSLGIELTIKRARRDATPPLQVSFGGSSENGGASVQVPSTPPSSARIGAVAFSHDTPPSTPSASKRRREASGESSPSVGREGMSVVALWNNGIEERKNEVGKRLRALCASDMEEWLHKSRGLEADHRMGMDTDIRPSTPEPNPERRAEVGAGGLLTPSATRPEGRRNRYVKFDESTLVGSSGKDPQPVDTQTTQTSVARWIRPADGDVLTEWHPHFSLRDARAIPCAVLPNLKDIVEPNHLIGGGGAHRHRDHHTTGSVAASIANQNVGLSSPAVGSSSTSLAAGPPSRAQSLMDRIKAKEEFKRSSLQVKAGLNGSPSSSSLLSGAPTTNDLMASFKRRATLSRLNDVATSLHMLFVTSSDTPTISSPSSTSSSVSYNTSAAVVVVRRSPILPLTTVLTSLSKSSRVTLSTAEARGCLDLLEQVCPGFLDLRTVGGREWVKAGEVGLAEVRRKVKAELDK